MRNVLPAFLIMFIFPLPAMAAGEVLTVSTIRPVHTYSIVARDPASGQLGVAVQSHWFSVGALIPWAEAGTGAVATQSFVDVRYGVSGLELMGDGMTAQAALDRLVREDPNPEVRQVGMIDARGRVATYTGADCIKFAGHLQGENFSVQSNLMIKEGVPEAMAAVFKQARGSLAERLLAALEAAQAAGGDLRGKQSAALLVVSGQATGRPWQDRIVDLHIEDHPAPLQELRRLLNLNTAYEHMNRGDHALENNDVSGALAEYGKAQALVPDNLEMKFWHAVALANAGKQEAAISLFATIFRHDERWRILLPRLAEAGLLTADPAALNRFVNAGLITEDNSQ